MAEPTSGKWRAPGGSVAPGTRGLPSDASNPPASTLPLLQSQGSVGAVRPPNVLDALHPGQSVTQSLSAHSGVGPAPAFLGDYDDRLKPPEYKVGYQLPKSLQQNIIYFKREAEKPGDLPPGYIEGWLGGKIGEIGKLIDDFTKEKKKENNLQAVADASTKSAFLGSELGRIWVDHQLYSILAYGTAGGKAVDAATDVVHLLYQFSQCWISMPEMVEMSGYILAKYKMVFDLVKPKKQPG